MNRKVRIIVDSAADVPESIKDKVTILPMTLRFGDDEYLDGVTITKHEFYEKLIESDVLPTTSQIMPLGFEEAYREALSQGEEVVVITVSSKLSGTYQSACIAKEEVGSDKVFVVDSLSVSIGEGILAQMAVSLMEEGKNAKEIADVLTKESQNIRVIALLNTLEYLKKGGRISKTVAFAGEMLSIKPVVNIVNGEVNLLGKARGSKQGNNLLVKEIENAGGVDFEKPLLLGYTGLDSILLHKYIEDSRYLWKDNAEGLSYALIGGIIGTHVGPGAVAVAFFKK